MKAFRVANCVGVFLALCVSTQAAFSQADTSAIDRQNQILQQQQLQQLRQEQERAQRTPPKPPGIDLNEVKPKITVPVLGVKCREIDKIKITGATLLPQALRAQIEQKFSHRCLDVSDIEAALALITKDYIERGYVTTRAYLPAQDLRSGTLDITVIEGTIERYQVDTPRPESVWTPGAFPAAPGEPLNLRDLEQGIDQINRLASNSATLDLKPGDKPGQSVVVVHNPAKRPINFFLSYDNYGTSATGRNSVSGTMTLDSVLGFNELIMLTHRQSVPSNSSHAADADALQVSVPFGYNTFTFGASRSTYDNSIGLPSGNSLLSNGDTTTYNGTLDRVIFRNQASRVSASVGLTVQDTKNYFGGQFLGIASRKLVYSDIGLSGFTALAGGVANARLGYVRGLPSLGALHDPWDLPSDAPHAQFGKFTLDLGFNRGFTLAGRPFTWSSQFSAQHADDTLYGSQQFLLGGMGTIRGSRVNTLSGDNGYLWRNELGMPWSSDLGHTVVRGRVYAAYDFGHVTNRVAGVPSGRMAGVTLGGSIFWKAATLDIFAARVTDLPAGFMREGTQYGIRLSFSL